MRIYNDNGYSLIEVLVGLLIFSVGALASGALIVASLHQNQLSKERSVSASLVAQRLEQLRERSWEDTSGGEDLAAGGAIVGDDQLRSTSVPAFTTGFFQTFNSDLSGARDASSKAKFYLVMWQVEDMTDSGLNFKRITIKGVAMHWSTSEGRWEPAASFDHVAMIFRELKVS